MLETESPPTALNVRQKQGFRLWCVLVIRSNQTDIECIPEIHAEKSEAIKQAQACRDRWQGVQMAVAPIAVDAAQLEIVTDAGELRIVADGIEGTSANGG